MKSLSCNIGDNWVVSAQSETGTKNNLNNAQRKVQISLYRKKNTSQAIATKHVPWPTSEQLPTEISYSEEEKCVELKSSTTVAKLPMNLSSLLSPSSCTDAIPKKYKSFSANPVPTTDYNGIVSAIKDLINNSEVESKWKELIKQLSAYKSSLGGVISSVDQNSLLTIISSSEKSTSTEKLVSLLSKLDVFGYRKQRDFYSYCMDNNLESVVIEALSREIVMSDEILCRLIKYAANQPSDSARKLLLSLLSHGFNETSLASCQNSSLTSDEFTTVVELCIQIFNDTDSQNVTQQALSLMSCLVDSHGSKLIWDTASHAKVLEILDTVTDMAALTDTFASFSAKFKKPVETAEDPLPAYRVRKVELPVRKITW